MKAFIVSLYYLGRKETYVTRAETQEEALKAAKRSYPSGCCFSAIPRN